MTLIFWVHMLHKTLHQFFIDHFTSLLYINYIRKNEDDNTIQKRTAPTFATGDQTNHDQNLDQSSITHT